VFGWWRESIRRRGFLLEEGFRRADFPFLKVFIVKLRDGRRCSLGREEKAEVGAGRGVTHPLHYLYAALRSQPLTNYSALSTDQQREYTPPNLI
jgi:hypothetical protein